MNSEELQKNMPENIWRIIYSRAYLCPKLPEDVWHIIFSKIDLSKCPQLKFVDNMFYNIYKEQLSIQICSSIFDNIFNTSWNSIGMPRVDGYKWVAEDHFPAGPLASGEGWSTYAVNYNVLRVMSGMGGIAYSN